jgi:hypothetical protein
LNRQSAFRAKGSQLYDILSLIWIAEVPLGEGPYYRIMGMSFSNFDWFSAQDISLE